MFYGAAVASAPFRLLPRIAAPDNLAAAWERVRLKRAAGGIDRQSVGDFAADENRLLDELRSELLGGHYVPHPTQSISIPKEHKPGEHRTLGLPAVRDKIAQEAARRVIEPILDRLFIDASYGYRPRRGAQRAVRRVSHYLGPGKCTWIVNADVDDFFPNLDHQLLLDALRPVLGDEDVLRLVALWLQMGSVDRQGRWHDVYSGVQQGAVIAPLLANFYLNPLDHMLTTQGYGLVRYADDMVICCRTREIADAALHDATAFLTGSLRLRFNADPRPIVAVEEGFTFLGIFFQGTLRLLPAVKVERARFRLRRIIESGDSLADQVNALREAAGGWRQYYGRLADFDSLEPLESVIADAAVEVLARAHRRERLDPVQAHAAIRALDPPRPVTATYHSEWLGEIVRRALLRPPEGTQASSTSSPTPRRRRRPRRRAAARPEAAPAPVAAVVRRRKREHLRRYADASELTVDAPGSFIGKQAQRLVVRRERRTVAEVAVERLMNVTVARAGVSLSADAIELCASRGVPIVFLSPTGEALALAQRPGWCDGETALAQLEAARDDRRAIAVAGTLVMAKIRSQIRMVQYLRKSRRRRGAELNDAIETALAGMGALADHAEPAQLASEPDLARGQLFSLEGRAAGLYWNVVRQVLASRVDFPGRRREGATDLVNSMLNYGYAVLRARVLVAIQRAGLNPHISFLHAIRPGVPSLSFDLMEQFRPPVVDRTVIALLMRRQPAEVESDGRLTDLARRTLLAAVLDRLVTLVQYRGSEYTLQEAIVREAGALARHLKLGQRYRPFAAKW